MTKRTYYEDDYFWSQFKQVFLERGVPDEETLKRRFFLLPEESAKILGIMYSLEYYEMDIPNKFFSFKNAEFKHRYSTAEKDLLVRAKYVDMLVDAQELMEDGDFFRWNMLVNLGRLAKEITGQEDSKSIYIDALIREIKSLKEDEYYVISYLIGMEESTEHFYWLCQERGISFEEVESIKKRGIEKLREVMCLFYVPLEEQRNQLNRERYKIRMQTFPIEEVLTKGFSSNLYKKLKDAGYSTAADFFGKSKEDFLSIQGIGDKRADYIIQQMKILGIV